MVYICTYVQKIYIIIKYANLTIDGLENVDTDIKYPKNLGCLFTSNTPNIIRECLKYQSNQTFVHYIYIIYCFS